VNDSLTKFLLIVAPASQRKFNYKSTLWKMIRSALKMNLMILIASVTGLAVASEKSY